MGLYEGIKDVAKVAQQAFFGTSVPEVVDIKENEDGTVTLTVETLF